MPRFRLTRGELAQLREEIRTRKLFRCSAAIERELIEAGRLGEAYPFRNDETPEEHVDRLWRERWQRTDNLPETACCHVWEITRHRQFGDDRNRLYFLEGRCCLCGREWDGGKGFGPYVTIVDIRGRSIIVPDGEDEPDHSRVPFAPNYKPTIGEWF